MVMADHNLPDQVLSNVRHLRTLGYQATDICDALGIFDDMDIRAVSILCRQPQPMKRYQGGTHAQKSGGHWTR
jgi:hypothetical protein